jgi:hypothetical protein
MTATTTPVPPCARLAAYPASVFTTTISGAFPEMVEPDREIELETITAMYEGILIGGPEL